MKSVECIRAAGRDREEGVALLLALGYLAVLTLLAAAFLSGVHRSANLKTGLENYIVTRNIAEGGLQKALASLDAQPAGYRGESNTPLGQGRFSVRVREGETKNTLAITVIGERADGEFVQHRIRIDAVARQGANGFTLTHWSEFDGQVGLMRGDT